MDASLAVCRPSWQSEDADIGLVPIAALQQHQACESCPVAPSPPRAEYDRFCWYAAQISRSQKLHSVAADTASRTTLAYSRILFHKWGNAEVPFIPMTADLDAMLDRADAAILIGDPALMALEERANRFERTGEELVYHDLAEEWKTLTGLPFVSAVWGVAGTSQTLGRGYRQGFHPIARSRITRTSMRSLCNGRARFRYPRAPSAPTSRPISTTCLTRSA